MRKKEILEKIKQRHLTEDGLIAYGKFNANSDTFRSVQGANSARYVVTHVGDQLCFIPLGHGDLYFNSMYVVDDKTIKSLNVTHFGSHLELVSTSGRMKVYYITRGRRDLKKMVAKITANDWLEKVYDSVKTNSF